MKPRYITDNKGRKVSVVLPVREYEKMLEDLEELEDIKLYDEVKAKKEPAIPIEKAFKIIESRRKRKK